MENNHSITFDAPPSANVRVYEYGVRLDSSAQQAVIDQIMMARHAYNEIIACMRQVVDELQAFVIHHAGEHAQSVQNQLELKSAEFVAARAQNDEAAMKRIAVERKALWQELSPLLRESRTRHRADIQSLFLSRIGKNSTCETYVIRCRAVDNGLGWATANAVLDAALIAFQKRFKMGKAPSFAAGSEKTQDTLTLQFTMAGGLSVADLLQGKHAELKLRVAGDARPRLYGEFAFRLGSAKVGIYASGTWQYHRELPKLGTVSLARLVRRRVGVHYKYALQFLVKKPDELNDEVSITRKPLVAVHFGWNLDENIRRIAAITEGADPCMARIITLPEEVESSLERAASIQSKRDQARDEVVPRIKAHNFGQTEDININAEIQTIKRLPTQQVALNRLHRLSLMLKNEGINFPDWFEAWRIEDRRRHQDTAYLARYARNYRKTFYRNLAAELAREYSAIVIEPLKLTDAAVKIDEKTGERTEFAKSARSGRVVAALYEFESALRWAAVKNESVLLELQGKTAQTCAYCGGVISGEIQELTCTDCGAVVDRKQNAVAKSWQWASVDYETHISDYWTLATSTQREYREKIALKKEKMSIGRKTANISKKHR